jgi:glycine/D-amino acid oxidase-like deaminating enzyme
MPYTATSDPDLGKPRPLWLDQAYGDDFKPAPELNGEVRADVAIVGGGYVGLWTALELKRRHPTLRIAILEREICGSGASGRNAGFAMPWWLKISTLEYFTGREEAVRLALASEEAVNTLQAFCRQYCPEAQVRRDGWIWAATAPAHVGSWDKIARKCEELGHPRFSPLSAKDIQDRIGTNTHLGGVYDADAATLHPGYLVRALRKRAIDLGVMLFEKTRVRDVQQTQPALIVTEKGKVKADAVVLAINAWAATYPGLRGRIAVIAADLMATAPIPDRLSALGWTHGEGVINARQRIQVYRTTTDGRMYFGRGGGGLAYGGYFGSRFNASPTHSMQTARAFRRVFPMLSDVKIGHNWTAPIDMSPSSLPFFGSLGRYGNVVYGVGWSGYGVAISQVGGRILASMATRIRDEWSTSGLVERSAEHFPPEPIKYFGGKLVQAAVTYKEEAEDLREKPSMFTALMSRFAPKH